MSGPERIWAAEAREGYGEWQTMKDGLPRPALYIRAEIHDAAVKALREIARQKRTDELGTKYDVECADFEGGYDECISRARAALAKIGEAG